MSQDIRINTDLASTHQENGLREAVLMLFCAYDTKPDKREIADRLKISYGTVCSVCASKEFKTAYQEICRAISHDRLREVLVTNADLAVEGDPKHTAIYLKVHGLLYDKSADKPSEPEKITDSAELEARKIEIMKQLKEEARKEVEIEMNRKAVPVAFTEVKT